MNSPLYSFSDEGVFKKKSVWEDFKKNKEVRVEAL
jgi:hypothetical protein